jgi:hypothetical protein
MARGVLIGRDLERASLEAALEEALGGRGSLVLLAGEAGVGKTRFAEEVLSSAEARFLRGSAGPATQAYGPVVGVLREYARAVPGALADIGPLRAHLALLLPGSAQRPRRPTAPRCSRRSGWGSRR